MFANTKISVYGKLTLSRREHTPKLVQPNRMLHLHTHTHTQRQINIIESTLSQKTLMTLNAAPMYFQPNDARCRFLHGCISGKSKTGAARPCVAVAEGVGCGCSIMHTWEKQLPTFLPARRGQSSCRCCLQPSVPMKAWTASWLDSAQRRSQ